MAALRARYLALVAPALLASVVDASAASAGATAALFADDQPLGITLELPLTSLVRRRMQRPSVAGTVIVPGSTGEGVRLDVKVTTRGHNRLEKCAFPPIGLNFKRSQTGGTPFAGQDRLKLVTLCRDASGYEDYLELERLIYHMYQQVSGFAFRVRPVEVRYVDTDRAGEARQAPAFLLEHIDEVATRAGMSASEVPPAQVGALDAATLAMLGLFEYLIGNTDWSVMAAAAGRDCCHNIALLVPREGGGSIVPVPYDFDSSGLVDAPYAEPSDLLKVTSVRQRVYRGFCASNDRLEEAIAALNAARPAMEGILAAGRLGTRAREKAATYLAAGYEMLNDPQLRQRQIIGRCREG